MPDVGTRLMQFEQHMLSIANSLLVLKDQCFEGEFALTQNGFCKVV